MTKDTQRVFEEDEWKAVCNSRSDHSVTLDIQTDEKAIFFVFQKAPGPEGERVQAFYGSATDEDVEERNRKYPITSRGRPNDPRSREAGDHRKTERILDIPLEEKNDE